LAPTHGHKPEDIDLGLIGYKPGEKLYEELMSEEETRRALELKKYFVVLPAFEPIYRKIDYDYPELVSRLVDSPYHSCNQKQLSRFQLLHFLRRNDLIGLAPGDPPVDRCLPDESEALETENDGRPKLHGAKTA
jgi:hypothetical protein